MNEEQLKRLKVIIKKIVKDCIEEETLAEESSTGTGASFSPGQGEQYATPFAFSKKGDNKGTQNAEKMGFKKVNPKTKYKAKTFDITK